MSRWMDTANAAKYVGFSPRTLKAWRSRGEGPDYHVVAGRYVRYDRADLDAFVTGRAASADP